MTSSSLDANIVGAVDHSQLKEKRRANSMSITKIIIPLDEEQVMDCPFCGHASSLYEDSSQDGISFYCKCDNNYRHKYHSSHPASKIWCEARGEEQYSVARAIEAWNARLGSK